MAWQRGRPRVSTTVNNLISISALQTLHFRCCGLRHDSCGSRFVSLSGLSLVSGCTIFHSATVHGTVSPCGLVMAGHDGQYGLRVGFRFHATMLLSLCTSKSSRQELRLYLVDLCADTPVYGLRCQVNNKDQQCRLVLTTSPWLGSPLVTENSKVWDIQSPSRVLKSVTPTLRSRSSQTTTSR